MEIRWKESICFLSFWWAFSHFEAKVNLSTWNPFCSYGHPPLTNGFYWVSVRHSKYIETSNNLEHSNSGLERLKEIRKKILGRKKLTDFVIFLCLYVCVSVCLFNSFDWVSRVVLGSSPKFAANIVWV